MPINIESTSSLLKNPSAEAHLESLNPAKDNSQDFSIHPRLAKRLNFDYYFDQIKDFFSQIVAPDSLIGKISILAKKTWEFIKSDWDIIVATVALIALSFFINPALTLMLAEITSEFTIGFATGVALTHFFHEKLKPLTDRLKSTNDTLQTAVITITMALFAPIGIFIAGFNLGNDAHGKLK